MISQKNFLFFCILFHISCSQPRYIPVYVFASSFNDSNSYYIEIEIFENDVFLHSENHGGYVRFIRSNDTLKFINHPLWVYATIEEKNMRIQMNTDTSYLGPLIQVPQNEYDWPGYYVRRSRYFERHTNNKNN